MKLTKSDPLGFNDENHLNNFINYLVRTDYAQKWTCDDTVYNCIALSGSNSENIVEDLSPKLTERKVSATSIKSITSKLLTDYKKNISSLENTLYKIEAEPGEILNKLEFKQKLLKISQHINALNKKEQTICYSLHSDQAAEGLHVHRLYIKI